MSKATKIAQRVSAKAAQLAAKRERSENAHADAIAYCDANKVSGSERLGYIAFASTAMQLGSARGAIAQAALAGGKAATFTYAQLAKAAKVSVADMSRANLAYIRHNIEFRRDLVGFSLDFDTAEETVTVKRISVSAKKPRSAKPKKAVAVSGETEAA